MGSIGGNTSTSPWYQLPPQLRPEAGLLKLRKSLNLFANLRPAYLYEELKEACPLREDIIGDGFDMMIMRELTGGLYFGARKTEEVDGVLTAEDTLTYNEQEIRRIAIKGFEIARKRRHKVTSVDLSLIHILSAVYHRILFWQTFRRCTDLRQQYLCKRIYLSWYCGRLQCGGALSCGTTE